MPRKKKKETLEDVMDRIEEDLNTLRHMVWDMQCEDNSSDDEDEDFDDEDFDDENDEKEDD